MCANVRFPSPASLLGDVVDTVTGTDRDADPWAPGRAVWPLLELIDAAVSSGDGRFSGLAAHLARAGVRDVVLLEAGELGGGSSGKPLGGVRAQFSDPANIALGLRSLAAYAAFGDDYGVDIGLARVGYLFLLRTAADVAAFTTSRNRPSVTTVIGKVSTTRIGRTKALTIPSSTAAITSVRVSVKSTPGTICAASHSPSAVTIA